jgi:hypothetical protein
MKKFCTDDTVNGNSHILEMNSESEGHTGHDLILWTETYTGHDLILGDEQDRISYIIKTLDYTQEMVEKFLNMRSSTKVSNSVDLGQCISRDLDGLNQDQVIIFDGLNQDQVIISGGLDQDQVINKMKFHHKIQSSANQRGAIDGFCGRVKYGHFRPDKYGHFGSDKDEFYIPDKWFRA